MTPGGSSSVFQVIKQKILPSSEWTLDMTPEADVSLFTSYPRAPASVCHTCPPAISVLACHFNQAQESDCISPQCDQAVTQSSL
jgi:hypothetical protein